MSIPQLKSGWLLRESTLLKRWKRNFFVFYADGNLAYFEDVSLQERIGNFNMVGNCKAIQTALQCRKDPPENKQVGCLIKLLAKDGDDILLCAESIDDAMAWKMTLEQPLFISQQRRNLPNYPGYPIQQGQPPPHPTYYYPNYGVMQVMYTPDGKPYFVHPQTQVIHVIREDDPYYYRPRRSGLLYGAALGAALWMPFWLLC